MEKNISDLRKEKARNLRYKKAIVRDLNLDAIRESLWEMSEVCSDIRYFYDDGNSSLLNELIGDEDEAFEFRMTFSDLDNDVNRMLDDMENEYIPDCFDDFFSSIGAGESMGGMLGWDGAEQDYFGIAGFEQELATEESAKRMMRYTKAQLIDAAHVCFRVAVNYMGLRNRYDSLKASIDVLRGENAGYLQVIQSIQQAYDRAAEDHFSRFSKSTMEFQKLVESLPDEAWVQ